METINYNDLLSWSQCWIYLVNELWYNDTDLDFWENTKKLLKNIWYSEDAWKYFNN